VIERFASAVVPPDNVSFTGDTYKFTRVRRPRLVEFQRYYDPQ
jgi:hypothetical protein